MLIYSVIWFLYFVYTLFWLNQSDDCLYMNYKSSWTFFDSLYWISVEGLGLKRRSFRYVFLEIYLNTLRYFEETTQSDNPAFDKLNFRSSIPSKRRLKVGYISFKKEGIKKLFPEHSQESLLSNIHNNIMQVS